MAQISLDDVTKTFGAKKAVDDLSLEIADGEFFVLLDGTATVRRGGRKVNTLGPGDFFGEIALVSRSPRTATVTTTSPARLLVITDGRFRTLLEHSPRIQLRILEALADRLAEAGAGRDQARRPDRPAVSSLPRLSKAQPPISMAAPQTRKPRSQ